MNIIINHSSMQPIYEQIMGQIKERIMHGELKEDTALPSVRTFAKELKVSAHCYSSWERQLRCLCEPGDDAGRKEKRSRS